MQKELNAMLNELKNCYIEKKQDPNRKIFYRKIDEYNKNREMYAHYILLKTGQLMIIEWRHSWEYYIAKLETEE